MALKKHQGSCHCGAVRFEVELDLSKGTNRCNCSICFKNRTWFAIVKDGHFTQLEGKDALTDYQWNSPATPEPVLHFLFCEKCGVRTWAWGEAEMFGGRFFAVSIPALDNLDQDELAAAPINFADGKNNHFNKAPADTRNL